MRSVQTDHEKPVKQAQAPAAGTGKEAETSNIGTLISVGLVGAGIFVTYLVVYGVYMARV